MMAELELVKGEFALSNMTEAEIEAGTSTGEIISSVSGGLAGVATLFAAIPSPPLQIGATLFAGMFSIVSVVASATDPKDENVSSSAFESAVSRSLTLLTLKGAEISLNFYRLFLNYEASRRRLRKLVLYSMSLLEGFALLEGGLINEGIEGLPDIYAPRNLGLRPMI